MPAIDARLLPEPPHVSSLAGSWLAPEREETFALPTVANSAGLVQVAWGPTGIQNWVAAPLGCPTPTGRLYRLGEGGPRRVDPAGTRYRWAPWAVEREHPVVSCTTTLHAEDAAVTEALRFHEDGTYLLVFGGLARTWSFTDYWNLPPEDVPQLSASWDGEAVLLEDTKTFGLARIVPTCRPTSVRTYRDLDEFHAGRAAEGRGRLVALEFSVRAGDEVRWSAALGTDRSVTPVSSADDAATASAELWKSAFTPGNLHFSGHLPALDFAQPELTRLYYMSVLSCLNSRRTMPTTSHRARFATGGQAIWAGSAQPLTTAYTWGGSEGAPTTSFLWEVQQQAALLARLDPQVLRTQLEAFLRADMSSHWGIDVLTGRGVGMWYGVNDGAIITCCADYLRITGDLAWLDHEVDGSSVRVHLLRHLDRIDELASGAALSDFGKAENLLECISTYEHRVASFNAMAAWCHRYAATVLDPDRAELHLARAEAVEAAVRDLMRPEGYFDCDTPDGRRAVRTCLDFIYVGRFMGDRLDEAERAAMLRFFVSELETVDWMRALSLADSDAFTDRMPYFQTYRADHQACGSYDGWPGWAAEVRLRFGDVDDTLAWMRRMSAVTWEGPFGQAHWTGTTEEEGRLPATKSGFFNGNCYLEACGVTFATTLLDAVLDD